MHTLCNLGTVPYAPLHEAKVHLEVQLEQLHENSHASRVLFLAPFQSNGRFGPALASGSSQCCMVEGGVARNTVSSHWVDDVQCKVRRLEVAVPFEQYGSFEDVNCS